MKFGVSLCLVFVLFVNLVLTENKYTRTANEKSKEKKLSPDIDFRKLDKPFRMNKLNLVWTKAQHRLTEPKLKSLYSDLMIQDKEEMILKRVKSEGGDKDGMKEAELRKKLTNLMTLYGLREHFDNTGNLKAKTKLNDITDAHINKSLFKDKKLNQLWSKAEIAGFTSEELAALKEEFYHHQDKIDQYYELLDNIEEGKKDEFHNAVNEEELDKYNEISSQLETNEFSKDYLDKTNLVRNKHRSLRDGYDRLHRITAKGPNSKEFIEPKVQGLWKIAIESNFSVDELDSLKVELLHYENRLLKLRHLHADHVSTLERHRSKVAAAGDKMDHFDDQQQMIKKHTRKVEKMHAELETKILARHNEL